MSTTIDWSTYEIVHLPYNNVTVLAYICRKVFLICKLLVVLCKLDIEQWLSINGPNTNWVPWQHVRIAVVIAPLLNALSGTAMGTLLSRCICPRTRVYHQWPGTATRASEILVSGWLLQRLIVWSAHSSCAAFPSIVSPEVTMHCVKVNISVHFSVVRSTFLNTGFLCIMYNSAPFCTYISLQFPLGKHMYFSTGISCQLSLNTSSAVNETATILCVCCDYNWHVNAW